MKSASQRGITRPSIHRLNQKWSLPLPWHSRQYRGAPADVGVFPAATDAPHFLCPAVVCGPGSINQAHTLDEYVTIAELTASARIYLRAVLQLLG